MRVRFVVFQQDVESRFVLLYQVRFENESLDLVVDDDELKVRDQFYELSGLWDRDFGLIESIDGRGSADSWPFRRR